MIFTHDMPITVIVISVRHVVYVIHDPYLHSYIHLFVVNNLKATYIEIHLYCYFVKLNILVSVVETNEDVHLL